MMIARCPIKNRSDDRKSFPLINFGLRLVGSAGLLILLTLGATSQISTPPLKPPPPELFFEGQMSQNLSAGPYGEASFELDWKAKRIDFRWDEVKKDYEDFYDWFTTRKDELENRFAAAQGRGKISAARELFEFALEAEEKKKQLDSNRVYSGKWEGEGEEITVVSKLGTFRIHLKISFATFPVNATALYPDYLISGESPSGKYTVRVDTFFDVNQRVHLDESFDFRATLSGKYRSRENLILLDVLPKDITGMTKAQMTAERLGTLRTVATYRKGTLHQRSSWPSMEAFLAYCKIITGDMSPPPELEATKPVPEEEILETFQLDGRLNWTPDDIPDLKHDYFRLWFDISGASSLRKSARRRILNKRQKLPRSFIKYTLKRRAPMLRFMPFAGMSSTIAVSGRAGLEAPLTNRSRPIFAGWTSGIKNKSIRLRLPSRKEKRRGISLLSPPNALSILNWAISQKS